MHPYNQFHLPCQSPPPKCSLSAGWMSKIHQNEFATRFTKLTRHVIGLPLKWTLPTYFIGSKHRKVSITTGVRKSERRLVWAKAVGPMCHPRLCYNLRKNSATLWYISTTPPFQCSCRTARPPQWFRVYGPLFQSRSLPNESSRSCLTLLFACCFLLSMPSLRNLLRYLDAIAIAILWLAQMMPPTVSSFLFSRMYDLQVAGREE